MSEQKESISINKYISSTGLCSRREADRWIEAQRVSLNGEIAQKGNRVSVGDEVRLDGELLQKDQEQLVYLAFYKPTGLTCTTDTRDENNIVERINYPQRIFPINRLDKLSEGIVLLSNDGDIVNQFVQAEENLEMEYLVTVNQNIKGNFIRKLSSGGLLVNGIPSKKCYAKQIDRRSFKIILQENKNRQIHNMCHCLGYRVLRLQRIRILSVSIPHDSPNNWRQLSPDEVQLLKQAIHAT